MVASFSVYICSLSSSLELPGRWTRVRRNPLHWHMSDPRRIILSDQQPWSFTRSTISYGAPSWFLLLGRIVIKVWDLSPMQRLKFLLPHTIFDTIQKTQWTAKTDLNFLTSSDCRNSCFYSSYTHIRILETKQWTSKS